MRDKKKKVEAKQKKREAAKLEKERQAQEVHLLIQLCSWLAPQRVLGYTLVKKSLDSSRASCDIGYDILRDQR